MNRKLTAAGAKQVTNEFDRLANLVQAHHALLGIPEKIAVDFAYRCDLLSDHVTKEAADFDPAQIGDQVPGPLEGEADESYMSEFVQEEHSELGDMVDANGLGKAAQVKAQVAAVAAKLAALDAPSADAELRTASTALKAIQLKFAASSATAITASVAKIVAAVDHVASALMTNTSDTVTMAADKIKQAASEVVPTFNMIVAAEGEEFDLLVQDASVAKLAALAAKIAEAAASTVVAGEEPAEEDEDENEESSGKTAAEDFYGFNLFA